MQRQPTDEQLTKIVRFIARVCLEVERGLRPPEHLLQFMTQRLAERWQRAGRIGRFTGGPVRGKNLGLPQLTRTTDGDVIATVTTSTDHGRWGALVLQLRSDGQRWSIAEVQRLLANTHYRTNDRTLPSPSLLASADPHVRTRSMARRTSGR